jgi:hypothetical protein
MSHIAILASLNPCCTFMRFVQCGAKRNASLQF